MKVKQQSFPQESLARPAEACLSQLEEEEAVLRSMSAALRHAQEALIRGAPGDLEEALAQQKDSARLCEEARLRREQIQRKLALHQDCAVDAVTLTWLARRVPSAIGAQLLACRDRLRMLTDEVQELNRCNAVLINHSLRFVQQLLQELTGGEAHGSRYGPAGMHQQTLCGSILSARG
jgi:flagellar biosynthesis/type III secretory pathway chaperone